MKTKNPSILVGKPEKGGPKTKTVTNLGWLLRNWQKVERIRVVKANRGNNDAILSAKLKGGGWYATPYASTEILQDFLDRPVFQGLEVSWFGKKMRIGKYAWTDTDDLPKLRSPWKKNPSGGSGEIYSIQVVNRGLDQHQGGRIISHIRADGNGLLKFAKLAAKYSYNTDRYIVQALNASGQIIMDNQGGNGDTRTFAVKNPGGEKNSSGFDVVLWDFTSEKIVKVISHHGTLNAAIKKAGDAVDRYSAWEDTDVVRIVDCVDGSILTPSGRYVRTARRRNPGGAKQRAMGTRRYARPVYDKSSMEMSDMFLRRASAMRKDLAAVKKAQKADKLEMHGKGLHELDMRLAKKYREFAKTHPDGFTALTTLEKNPGGAKQRARKVRDYSDDFNFNLGSQINQNEDLNAAARSRGKARVCMSLGSRSSVDVYKLRHKANIELSRAHRESSDTRGRLPNPGGAKQRARGTRAWKGEVVNLGHDTVWTDDGPRSVPYGYSIPTAGDESAGYLNAAAARRGMIKAGNKHKGKQYHAELLADARKHHPRLPNPAPGQVDEEAAHELYLHIISDGNIYRIFTANVIANLKKKFQKGTYNPTLAIKAFEYVADYGARSYNKEFGDGRGFGIFSAATRKETAKALRDYYSELIKS